jgi:hypothetical protein
MEHGFGPYGIITNGEVFGTLIVAVAAICAMLVMAYRTRRHA